MSGQAEQELGKWVGKQDEREFEVEAVKIESWKLGGIQDLGGSVYPVREVNDGEKNAGEDDTCIQIEQEFGNGVDNGIVGVEFHKQEDGTVAGGVGNMKAGLAQCIGSWVASVAVGRVNSVDVDRCVSEQEVGVG